jgi:plasmid replication initiation protein
MEPTTTEPAPDDPDERDVYAWTQDQAARQRALAGGNRFDVAHVAEEIEDLGANQSSAVASHLR